MEYGKTKIEVLHNKLGQAPLKLGFDFTLFLCRFGFVGFGMVKLVWWILFCRFDQKYLVSYIWFFTFQNFVR